MKTLSNYTRWKNKRMIQSEEPHCDDTMFCQKVIKQIDDTKWWHKMMTQSNDKKWRHKVMIQSDAKKYYKQWCHNVITKQLMTNVITQSDYTPGWNKVMTQSNDTKWRQKVMTQIDYTK